ncbi:MAG: Crp/Fnr family transcriptional regulator [Rhodocyclaceae bacterium]|nr:Crp/Fnr family transcriptional regulator [Rhodocyclaceae bacterium]MBX3669267.1 Crp/Fnr family transcriptional regulator [Rhodocyclaceae bacterium]
MTVKARHGIPAMKVGSADCRSCPVRKLGLMGPLATSSTEAIQACVDVLHFRAHARIYSEDTAGSHLYSVRSGIVKLEQDTPSGRTRILRLAMPGDTLGLELMTGFRYKHTAQALRATEVCRIPAVLVRELRESSAALRESLQIHMQRTVDAAEFQIAQFCTGNAQSRIARLLLHLAPEDRTDGRRWIMREDMAALLGVTLETVSRTISDMKRQGMLEECGHAFKFRRGDLERIAGS